MSEITWAVGIFSGDRRGNFAVATAFCSSILALRDVLDAAVTSTQ